MLKSGMTFEAAGTLLHSIPYIFISSKHYLNASIGLRLSYLRYFDFCNSKLIFLFDCFNEKVVDDLPLLPALLLIDVKALFYEEINAT